MVERQEVEAILAEVHSMAETNRVAVGDIAHPVEGDTLAALCRAWLALDSGQVKTVREASFSDGHSVGKLVVTTGQSMIGQRVRIVKEPVE